MQPTGELNQRGRVQRLKEGAVHASEVDRGVLAHRLHSELDRRPRRYPDHPLRVTSPQFRQGEVNDTREVQHAFRPRHVGVGAVHGQVLQPAVLDPVEGPSPGGGFSSAGTGRPASSSAAASQSAPSRSISSKGPYFQL